MAAFCRKYYARKIAQVRTPTDFAMPVLPGEGGWFSWQGEHWRLSASLPRKLTSVWFTCGVLQVEAQQQATATRQVWTELEAVNPRNPGDDAPTIIVEGESLGIFIAPLDLSGCDIEIVESSRYDLLAHHSFPPSLLHF